MKSVLTRILAVAMMAALPLVTSSPASAQVKLDNDSAHCGSSPNSGSGNSGGGSGKSGDGDVSTSAAKVTVWMAGDSTMQNATTCPIGWGNQFKPFFNADVTVVNSAVGGRSIQTWLYDPNVTTNKNAAGECIINNPNTFSTRWQAMLNSSTGMKAGDYLFIQFGINDSTGDCPRHVGTARYQQLMTMMVDAAKARGAHPIVLTAVAAIICSGNSAVANRGFLRETNAVAAAEAIPVIDLHQLSINLYNSLRFCPNNGDFNSGPVGAFFCADHTHFEAAGARQIAGVVAKALRDQNIPLNTYLV